MFLHRIGRAPAALSAIGGLILLAALPLAGVALAQQNAIDFDGANDYVTFGSAPGLGAATFTLECWFKREGTGTTTSTGTGGITSAIPLLTKGRGEAEGSNVDMNYFLGLRSTDNVLAADFEEGAGGASPGLNHPVFGVTPIRNDTWYHAAATYDGTTWNLYLNGRLEATLAVGQPPRSDSIQHAGIATAMTSSGAAAGFFAGVIDEPRIWNVARTQAEIQADMFSEVTAGTGLLGRWGLNEGSGTSAGNSVPGGVNGTLTNGPLWVTGTPFALENALALGSGTAYVTFGNEPTLGLPQFTLECWFKRDGAGTTVSTGTGGIVGIPLVTKGRGEADGDNRDMNYFFGIDGTSAVLVADFEEGAGGASPGLNHPVSGTTPILNGQWYHAAVTYDGTTWRLYLNGSLDGSLAVGQPPRSDSIQHSALGTALNSSGAASGHLDGTLDEVRIWDFARSESEIQGDINAQITTAQAGLVARWGLDEGAGTAVYGSAGTAVTGTITGSGWSWAASAPFDIIVNPTPPEPPTNLVATELTWAQVDLQWTDNSTDEQSFEIERSTTGAGGPFTPLATVPANTTTYADADLDPVSEYCYQVRAVNSGGPSAYTNVDCATTPAEGDFALDFGSGDAHVTFGPAQPTLGLAEFTLECWFRRDADGTTANTGTGGFLGVPLVTKGVGEAEASNVDMNYFLGIKSPENVLAADFEEGASGTSPGQNHPVIGMTVITPGVWYHAAATYDGTTWNLYLNGQLEATLAVGEPPRSDSIQHAGLGVALNSTGTPSGHFDGVLDEVRIWNAARTQPEIEATRHVEITTPEAGLVARWGLNEGAGLLVHGSAGTAVNGSILGAGSSWTDGAPIGVTTPPAAPTDLVATPAGGFQIDLTWVDNATDEGNFEIERSTTGAGGPFLLLATVPANTTSASDNDLEPESEYCYRVRAVNVAGASDYSNVDCATTSGEGDFALDFGGTDAYVTFGPALPDLGLATFTLECWFRRDGAGVSTTTGSGGVEAVPLVTKGRGEQDGSNVDMNYFLGIRASDGVLAADFEDAATGANHPIVGATPVTSDVWHHAAATYDGTTWRLYLDGSLDAELAIGETPRSDSIQHAALGSALTSTGVAAGYFDGVLDEVRIWDTARTLAEIQATLNIEITTAQPGLAARWGLNEGMGTVVHAGAGTTVDGAILGSDWSWTAGAPFEINLPPDLPVLVSPPDGGTGVPTSPTLEVTVSDPETANLTVNFYGRPRTTSTAPNFTVVLLPDTQYYTSEQNGASNAMLKAQTEWIIANRESRNIVHAHQLGDCTEHGDNDGNPIEWMRADTSMTILEQPSPAQPDGMPYGICVGNHDQSPNGDADGTTTFYNQYFGESRFAGRAYYGGHYGANNDNHYVLFSASGTDFILVSLEYDTSPDQAVLDWADGLLATYSDRKAILASHNIMNTGTQGSFAAQGQAFYNALRDNPNLFLMVCGHVPGEGRRTDTFNGSTVHTLLADYQSRTNGGSGWLRILEFRPTENQMAVFTYSPWLDQFETDGDSQFILPVDFTPVANWELIGTQVVGSGQNASIVWPDREVLTEYEWYVTVSDGVQTRTGPVWSFTTGETAGIDAAGAPLPTRLELLPARPNPFNPATTIHFRMPEAGEVEVGIYDVSGQLVRTLMAERLPAGEHAIAWDGKSGRGNAVGSGVYLIRLRVGARELTQKVQLIK